MDIEYVASGCTHLRINDPVMWQPHILPTINKIFSKLNTEIEDSKFSLLFNAYVEKALGEIIHPKFGASLHEIHSDSGGLQIITQGKTVTQEDKDQIYELQRRKSTIAMSFDQIPVRLNGNKTSVTDFSTRCFDLSLFDERAKESGMNLNKQLEFFRIQKDTYSHVTKPLLVVHGNSLELAQKWVNIVMDNIDNVNKPFIAGLATAASSMGFGSYETLQLSAVPYLLDIPSEIPKQYHILGVGSLIRMQPYLMFDNMFNNSHRISYDSTTHTSSINFGRYTTHNLNTIQANRKSDYIYNRIYNDITSRFTDIHMDRSKFIDAVQFNKTEYGAKYPNDDWYNYYVARLIYPADQIYTFMNQLNIMKKDLVNKKYDKFNPSLVPLLNVRDIKDFNEYLQWVKPFMKSKKMDICKKEVVFDLF